MAHHCRLLKQVLDKIEENSKFIAERRKHITFGISDVAAIVSFQFKYITPKLIVIQLSVIVASIFKLLALCHLGQMGARLQSRRYAVN